VSVEHAFDRTMTMRSPRGRAAVARLVGLVLALASAVSGCPEPKAGGGPKQSCAKEYEQCMLPNGVLGLCNPVECAGDQLPPCFVCRSQH
jgi:hypothetical protein